MKKRGLKISEDAILILIHCLQQKRKARKLVQLVLLLGLFDCAYRIFAAFFHKLIEPFVAHGVV